MISTYLVPLDQVGAARPDHMDFLAKLEDSGAVVGAGRQESGKGGIILLRAGSAREAVALLADDPYVLRGLARYDAVGWTVTRGPLASL